MKATLAPAMARIAADHRSSATALVPRAIDLLERARAGGATDLAAAVAGVPACVLAGRDRCLGGRQADRLELREGPVSEIWRRRPRGVSARNPYFERVPWAAVAALMTGRECVGAADVGELCRAMASEVRQADLVRFLASHQAAQPVK